MNVATNDLNNFKWGFESCENEPTNLGLTNFSQIENLTDGLAGVVVQSPNYYGNLEDWSIAKERLGDLG